MDWILEPHTHADHLSSTPYLAGELNGRIAIGEGIRDVQEHFTKVFNRPSEYQPNGAEFDHLLRDGEELETAGLTVKVIHTPGHASDSNSFLIGNALFAGDTLFQAGCRQRPGRLPRRRCQHARQLSSETSPTTGRKKNAMSSPCA